MKSKSLFDEIVDREQETRGKGFERWLFIGVLVLVALLLLLVIL